MADKGRDDKSEGEKPKNSVDKKAGENAGVSTSGKNGSDKDFEVLNVDQSGEIDQFLDDHWSLLISSGGGGSSSAAK